MGMRIKEKAAGLIPKSAKYFMGSKESRAPLAK
jgi:hypothetical protein